MFVRQNGSHVRIIGPESDDQVLNISKYNQEKEKTLDIMTTRSSRKIFPTINIKQFLKVVNIMTKKMRYSIKKFMQDFHYTRVKSVMSLKVTLSRSLIYMSRLDYKVSVSEF